MVPRAPRGLNPRPIAALHRSVPAVRHAAGFTYVGVLLMVALLGIGLGGVGTVWHTASMREREAELLFVGDQFRKAIVSYRDSSSGAKVYPKRLEDLVEDNRLPKARRHLRKIFRDPMTNGHTWGLVRAGDRIIGVYSQANGAPFRRAGFGDAYSTFGTAHSYRDWIFSAEDELARVSAMAARSGTASASEPGATPGAPAALEPEVLVEPAPTPRCVMVFNDAMEKCANSGAKANELIQCRKGAYAAYNACSAGG